MLLTWLQATPGWVLPGASLDMNFAAGTYYPAGVDSLITTTRAQTVSSYAQNSAGLWIAFGANTPRITDLGLLVEEARTNVVPWSRDLTNAAWTKSNITAALDQTGADGTANAATSLTATAGNGTCLQAITLASSARSQSAVVKRITGTGAIQMTMDNGSTWTAIAVTSSYAQLSIPTQTLANPTVGFRIVASGDAIAVDFVQNANGVFATSPIPTTTIAVARAVDNVTTVRTGTTTGGVVLSAIAPINVGSNRNLWSWSDGTANNRISIFQNSSGNILLFVSAGGVTQVNGLNGGNVALNASFKVAVRWRASSWGISVNGAAEVTQSSGSVPNGLISIQQGDWTGGGPWDSYIKRETIFPNDGINTVALSA